MKFEELVRIKHCHISFEQIAEPRVQEARLRIVINKSDNPTDLLIFPNPDCKVETLQIDFRDYVTYSVIYDDFTLCDDTEVFQGHSFRIYKKSFYLDSVLRGSSLRSQKLTHYSLACIEHKVDIISKQEPVILTKKSG
ncbi:hypothetical protein QTG56_00140 [Rossellomorea sp. AcN35-11]|nr:hypothetical protein [Rossellomorea aquimaris]WJV29628.1 hypothetical protein QTG56_00140 [Rossellomorea sp. AcN35-11]